MSRSRVENCCTCERSSAAGAVTYDPGRTDPAGAQRDAMTVVDCDAGSPTYGEVVGWAELPTAGNELHHFGWNACSSALKHEGHDMHGTPVRLTEHLTIR